MESKADNFCFSRLTYTTLAKLAQHPDELRMQIMAAHHPDVVQNVKTEEQAAHAMRQIAAANRAGQKKQSSPASIGGFTRGKIVLHKPSQTKVTIIHASVGMKNGESLHEVVNTKTGKKFLAKESNLYSVR